MQYDYPEINMWDIARNLISTDHDAIITTPLRQIAVETSFWRYNDVIIASWISYHASRYDAGKNSFQSLVLGIE